MDILFTLLDRHIRAVEHAIKGQTGVTVESYVRNRVARWLEDLVQARKEDRNAELLALLMAASNETQRQVRELLGQSND